MKAVVLTVLLPLDQPLENCQLYQQWHPHPSQPQAQQANVVAKKNQVVNVKRIVIATGTKALAPADGSVTTAVNPEVDLAHLSVKVTVLKVKVDDHLLLLLQLDDKPVLNQVIVVGHLLLVPRENPVVLKKSLYLLRLPQQMSMPALVLRRRQYDPIENHLALKKSQQVVSAGQRDQIGKKTHLAETLNANHSTTLLKVNRVPASHPQNDFQPLKPTRMRNPLILILILHPQLQ